MLEVMGREPEGSLEVLLAFGQNEVVLCHSELTWRDYLVSLVKEKVVVMLTSFILNGLRQP